VPAYGGLLRLTEGCQAGLQQSLPSALLGCVWVLNHTVCESHTPGPLLPLASCPVLLLLLLFAVLFTPPPPPQAVLLPFLVDIDRVGPEGAAALRR